MKIPVAVLDACVLYPAPLRDFFMHLAVLDAFAARWTEAIHDEWTRNVLKSRPDLRPDQLARTRELMNRHTRGAVVENYEHLIETLYLPDADDRHVLAAAIVAEAGYIVTFNLRDFPADRLAQYGVQAIHPDEFCSSLIETNSASVLAAARNQWKTLKNPPKPLADFLETLDIAGLTKTVEELRTLFKST
jgi:predicted nucleic acid-binding protein